MSNIQYQYRYDNYSSWIGHLQEQIQDIWLKQNELKNTYFEFEGETFKLQQQCQKREKDFELIQTLMKDIIIEKQKLLNKEEYQLNTIKEGQQRCIKIINKCYEQYINELFSYNRQFKTNQQVSDDLKKAHDEFYKEINDYKTTLNRNLQKYYNIKNDKRTQIRKMIRNQINKASQIKGLDKSICEMLTRYEGLIEKYEIKIDKKEIKLANLEREYKIIITSIEQIQKELNDKQIYQQNIIKIIEQEYQINKNIMLSYKLQQETINKQNYNLSLQCQELQRKFTPKLLKLYEYHIKNADIGHQLYGEHQSVCINQNGTLAISTVNEENVLLWENLQSKWQVKEHLIESQQILCITFSKNGNEFFCGTLDGLFVIWKFHQEKWKIIQTEQAHKRGIKSIIINNKDKFIITCSDDGSLKIWKYQINKWEIQQTLYEHKLGVFCISLNQNENIIASGSFDETILIWIFKDQSWKLNQKLEGHTSFITSLCFSQNKDILVSSSNDKTIKIWEQEINGNYRKIQTLFDHKSSINSVIFNSDSSILFSGSQDGNIKFWRQYLNGQWFIYKDIKNDYAISQIAISKDDKHIIIGTMGANTLFYISYDEWD